MKALKRQFENLRDHYRGWLEWSAASPRLVLVLFAVLLAARSLFTWLSDAISFRTLIQDKCVCTCCLPSGTRIEQSEIIFGQIERRSAISFRRIASR